MLNKTLIDLKTTVSNCSPKKKNDFNLIKSSFKAKQQKI